MGTSAVLEDAVASTEEVSEAVTEEVSEAVTVEVSEAVTVEVSEVETVKASVVETAEDLAVNACLEAAEIEVVSEAEEAASEADKITIEEDSDKTNDTLH